MKVTDFFVRAFNVYVSSKFICSVLWCRSEQDRVPGVLLLFPLDCQFSHNFLNLPLRPTTASVYKRSPSDGGQRYLVGLARSSPSNLRLAPSLHVLLIAFCTLHHPPSLNAQLALVENSRCQREEVAHRQTKRENSSLICPPFLPISFKRGRHIFVFSTSKSLFPLIQSLI